MATLTVVGAGAWGTALASHAARVGHDVRMWAREPEVAEEITTRHTNTPYLAGIELPASISALDDPAAAVAGAEVVILVPPSQHLRSVATGIRSALGPGALVVVATKGIEEQTLSLMSEVLGETLPAV